MKGKLFAAALAVILSLPAAAGPAGRAPVKIIFDTDIGNDVDDVHFALELALHDEKVGGKDGLSLRELYGGPDDEVDNAGLVFEAHEDDTGGGFGALAVGDDAGDADLAAAGDLAEIDGAADAERVKFATQ